MTITIIREFLGVAVGALQAKSLRNSIVACTSYLVLIAGTGELKLREAAACAGGTLCFFRELWQSSGFRDVNIAEDKMFVQDHNPERIGIDNPELYCYVRHNCGNTWSRWSGLKDQSSAAEDVTVQLRKLPPYSKSLKEYIPKEDLWFYENQIEGRLVDGCVSGCST